MSIRKKNKATSWKHDGKRGKKLSKRHANILERRAGKQQIDEERDKEWLN